MVTLLDGGEQLWRWPEPGHPDDPPLPEVRGVPRIMGTSAAFDRVLATVPSRITVCQGNFIPDDRRPAAIIRRWGNTKARPAWLPHDNSGYERNAL